MMTIKNIFKLTAVAGIGIFAAAIFWNMAFAEEIDSVTVPADLEYPIRELGNCRDEAACRVYCDDAKNLSACLDFAERRNMMPKEDIETAKKFAAKGGRGPGSCRGRDACENYCNDISHLDECLAFAEEGGIMPPEGIEEAKKVRDALKRGAKLPGGCANKKSCDEYCGNPDNMEECITFGEQAGFIPPEELGQAKKALEAIKRGVRPPPCRGKDACDAYCGEPGHFEECIAFAEAAGFVNPEEAKMARKTGGKGPGGCRGREECDTFCEKEENFETCMNFGLEHGLIPPDQAEMIKKTGGKGPGNCRGKEQCERFCEDPANQEVCFNFAKEHDLIPEEDLRRMEEGRVKMMEGFNNAPPEVGECLKSTLGEEMMNKIQSGGMMPGREVGDKMRGCFEKMGPPGGMMPGRGFGPSGAPGAGPGGEGGFGGAPQTGPGGCKTPEECRTYCENNPEQCNNFRSPEGGMMPQEGFKSPEGRAPSREEIERMMRDGKIPEDMMRGASIQEQLEIMMREGEAPAGTPGGMLQKMMTQPPQQQFRPPENFVPERAPYEGSVSPSSVVPPDGYREYQQFESSEAGMTPPPSYQPPYQPPTEGFLPPPPTELPPPPSSALDVLFGLAIGIFR